ncbi:winged helix-turn-helix domain-containing protein, partial [uncultured Duncaniella sp.]
KGEGISIEPNPLHSKGESNRIRVIRLLSDNGNLTLPEIADKLQLSLGGVEKIVRQLKKEGILSREGSTKAGKWIVKLED